MRLPLLLTMRCTLPLFWLLLRLSPISCSPIRGLTDRQVDVDCHNPKAVFDSSCWTSLGVTDFLLDDNKGWLKTTPVCSDSTRCCLTGEEWSTCFLRLGRGLAGQNCTTLDDQTCTWDNAVSSDLAPNVAAQIRYTIKAIYGVHDFFSSYYKGESAVRIRLFVAPP